MPPVGQAAGLGIGRRRNKVGASDTTAAEDQATNQQPQSQVRIFDLSRVLIGLRLNRVGSRNVYYKVLFTYEYIELKFSDMSNFIY